MEPRVGVPLSPALVTDARLIRERLTREPRVLAGFAAKRMVDAGGNQMPNASCHFANYLA
jgi:hypothetical protein